MSPVTTFMVFTLSVALHMLGCGPWLIQAHTTREFDLVEGGMLVTDSGGGRGVIGANIIMCYAFIAEKYRSFAI